MFLVILLFIIFTSVLLVNLPIDIFVVGVVNDVVNVDIRSRSDYQPAAAAAAAAVTPEDEAVTSPCGSAISTLDAQLLDMFAATPLHM